MLLFAQDQKQENLRPSIFRPSKSFFKSEIFISHVYYKIAGAEKINLVLSDSPVPFKIQYIILIK